VIVPFTNEKEVEDLPKYLRDEFTFIYGKQVDEVLPHLFTNEKQKLPRKSKAKIVRGKNVGKPRPKIQPPASPPG
jgi:predicted ATP-dependent protease